MRRTVFVVALVAVFLGLAISYPDDVEKDENEDTANEVQVREKRAAGVAAAVIAGYALLVVIADFAYGLHQRHQIMHQIQDISRKLDEVTDRLDELSVSMMRLELGQQWNEAATLYGDDIQNILFLINYLQNNLELEDDGTLSPPSDARRWARQVLEIGAMDKYLLNMHNMVLGSMPVFGQHSIVHLFMQRIKGNQHEYWDQVDDLIDFLYSTQVTGYAAMVIAANILYDNSSTSYQYASKHEQRQRDEEWRNRVETIRQNGQKRLEEQSKRVFDILADPSVRYWPRGTYGLPKVKGIDCPSGNWQSGSRFHDTEDGGRNEWSSGIHLSGDLQEGNMRWDFCMKLGNSGDEDDVFWPKGTYCIFRKFDGCPVGSNGEQIFQRGSVKWDDQDKKKIIHIFKHQDNKIEGSVPDGVYNKDTKIEFCCRSDGPTNDPINLPVNAQFMIFAHGRHSNCPRVTLMKSQEEWFWWDNEDKLFGRKNKNEVNGLTPKNSDNKLKKGVPQNHKLHFCYYDQDLSVGPA